MRDDSPSALHVQELRVFLVLAEELHFGRTAERLYLSQPQVSRLLASLEGRIGGKLLERTSRRVELTPLGASFQADLETAYGVLLSAVARARASATGLNGELLVGCTATTAGFALTRLVDRFEQDHPECRVVVRELPLTHPYGELHSGGVEVLVHWIGDREGGVVTGPAVDTQPRVLAVRRHHPLTAAQTVSVEVLADYGIPPWAKVSTLAWARALAPDTTPSGRLVERRGPACLTLSEALDLVARSDIVHPTVSSVAEANAGRRDLIFLPIHDLPPMRLGPIWLAGRENARIRAFVASARQTTKAADQRDEPTAAATSTTP